MLERENPHGRPSAGMGNDGQGVGKGRDRPGERRRLESGRGSVIECRKGPVHGRNAQQFTRGDPR